eukprot:gb/GECG01005138.1/.p1 GENE.gb/GECG01005138.1/~~gb/GECG01005138.1/.p1  ORF type:complete len:570 (+),score=103.94 gb/GECG01005138.1/:1-1710(+)
MNSSGVEAKNRAAVAKIKAKLPRFDPKKQQQQQLRPSLGQNQPHSSNPPAANGDYVRQPRASAAGMDEQQRKDVEDSEFATERAMFQQLMGNGDRRSGKGGETKDNPPTSNRGSVSESSLITQMSARLKVLEKSQREMRDELIKKEKKLLNAQRKQEAAEAALKDDDEVASEIASLRAENNQLRSQVYEMETFLNDYGLIWVGKGSNRRPGAGEDSEDDEEEEDEFNSRMPYRLEFDVIKKRIEELNALAGEGQKKVVHNKAGVGAQLGETDTLPLTLYKDGFMLRRGPFRQYDTESAEAFFTDVMDGYFPYELKDEFPEGVVFKLFDKSDKKFEETGDKAVNKCQFSAFNGEGQRLGGESAQRPASGNYRDAPSNVKSLAQVGDPSIALSSRDFLNRLPTNVVRNGNVVGIRSEVSSFMHGGKKDSGVIVVETPVVKGMQGNAPAARGSETDGNSEEEKGDGNQLSHHDTFRVPASGEEQRPVTPHDVATIQVRSDSGRQVLVIKLRFDDTVGDLKRYIDLHRNKETPYEIRTAFPAKAYTTPENTLRHEGLVPNATVMLRPVGNDDQ